MNVETGNQVLRRPSAECRPSLGCPREDTLGPQAFDRAVVRKEETKRLCDVLGDKARLLQNVGRVTMAWNDKTNQMRTKLESLEMNAQMRWSDLGPFPEPICGGLGHYIVLRIIEDFRCEWLWHARDVFLPRLRWPSIPDCAVTLIEVRIGRPDHGSSLAFPPICNTKNSIFKHSSLSAASA